MWILTSKDNYKQNMWAIYVNNMWGSIQKPIRTCD